MVVRWGSDIKMVRPGWEWKSKSCPKSIKITGQNWEKFNSSSLELTICDVFLTYTVLTTNKERTNKEQITFFRKNLLVTNKEQIFRKQIAIKPIAVFFYFDRLFLEKSSLHWSFCVKNWGRSLSVRSMVPDNRKLTVKAIFLWYHD